MGPAFNLIGNEELPLVDAVSLSFPQRRFICDPFPVAYALRQAVARGKSNVNQRPILRQHIPHHFGPSWAQVRTNEM